jgi:C_GCAxxG_C_C family probable redox protein
VVDVSQKHEYLAIKNVLSMGHCAPTVARTLLQSEGIEDPQLIKLMAAMPGGIGNSGAECGGVTAPLMHLGLRFGYDLSEENQVRVISLGQSHLRAFERLHRTVLCHDIRARGVLYPCLKAIYTAPDLILGTMDELAQRDPYVGIPPATVQVLHEFNARDFHCCHSVLRLLDDGTLPDETLLRASWGFLGGTVLQRLTCGALTAGVMAIGLGLGQIEDRPHKVIQMIALLVSGGDAMRDDVNRFNPCINASHKLVSWFEETFGSCQCRGLIESSASDPQPWKTYLSQDRVDQCRVIACRTAEKVREILGGSSRPVCHPLRGLYGDQVPMDG